MDLKSIEKNVIFEIEKAKTKEDLKKISQKYFGKKGEISKLFKSLKEIPREKRAQIGKDLNFLKKRLTQALKQKERAFEVLIQKMPKFFDVTLPGEKIEIGNLHPLTQVLWLAEEIFEKMGFEIVEGPEIEDEWHNFDALNIPKDHPARDLWNTLWLQSNQKTRNKPQILNSKFQKLLLRTHTSPVQIRYLEKNQPPLRIIVPGRVFRHEATDASHEIQFYQLEGLLVDKEVSLANLKKVLIDFLELFFGKVKIRFRPGFFPFTEPSIEVDVKTNSKWIEILGAGMVHPNVFENSGLNPKEWKGFAFGFGIDRLAMAKYKIDDIRFFYSGDLRFLNQF